jgi:UDP-glucose 4-epimerase
MKILVTGGAGYIGSHTCIELLQAGHEVIVVDNLINSKEESLKRVQEITGKTLAFHKVDLLNERELDNVFHKSSIDAVIHFAGLKAVGESVSIPLRYYHNNVTGALILCNVMENSRGILQSCVISIRWGHIQAAGSEKIQMESLITSCLSSPR